MPFEAQLGSDLLKVVYIVAAMGVVALIEVAVPLRARDRTYREHVPPNLTLTAITFVTSTLLNTWLVLTLVRIEQHGFSVAAALALPGTITTLLVVLVLDFSFYVAHVAQHHMPLLWRFHRVHHSDAALDVTTTIRQHPGEGVIRYVFLATAAIAFGASPQAFAIYRVWSAISGLLEHANIRLNPRFDHLLSYVITTPNMHKVHHSRDARETNTNYANIFALFDRLFGTYTRSERGLSVTYGLDDCDGAQQQTTSGLLAMPFASAAKTTEQPAR